MSSERAVSKGARFLSKGLAAKPRFPAAVQMLPTPLHNSTTSKSRGKDMYSGFWSTSQNITATPHAKCTCMFSDQIT